MDIEFVLGKLYFSTYDGVLSELFFVDLPIKPDDGHAFHYQKIGYYYDPSGGSTLYFGYGWNTTAAGTRTLGGTLGFVEASDEAILELLTRNDEQNTISKWLDTANQLKVLTKEEKIRLQKIAADFLVPS
jgi:hypothetical protein